MNMVIMVVIFFIFSSNIGRSDTVIDSSYFRGTYEFEILGRPMRFYVCESQDDSDAMYWAGSDLVDMEYTYIVGRDIEGPIQINLYLYETECEIFRLYGHEILTGFWKIRYNKRLNEYVLYERFPELQHQDEEDWNTYALKKISYEIVANPEMRGLQCFAPSADFPISSPSDPECWISILHAQQSIAHQFFEGNDAGCWVFATPQGLVIRGGYNYGFREEWDGGLLIVRWDDQSQNNAYRFADARYNCQRGSMFVVQTGQNEAIFSFQCEDRVTGDQYLAIQQHSDSCSDMTCPIWTDDMSRLLSANPTPFPTSNPTFMLPTSDPIVDSTINPTFVLPTSDPVVDSTFFPSINPTFVPSINPTAWPTIEPTLTENEENAYELVESILAQCVGDEFDRYLSTFKEEHVTDFILPLLSDSEWSQLVEELGFRVCIQNAVNDLF